MKIPIKSTFVANMRILISTISPIQRVALFYLGAISLAEVFTTLFQPEMGLALHGLILLVLLLQAAHSDQSPTRRFLLALTLAPLIRLLSLVLPLLHFPMMYWYLLVGAPVFLAAIFAAHAGNWTRVELGLTLEKLPIQLLVSLTGIGLGLCEYVILRPKPLVAEFRFELILPPAIILLIFTGVLEEFIFRGMMQPSSIKSLGRYGMIYPALVFTILHLGYHSIPDLLFVFAVALFFGWIVQRSGSILGVSLAHGLINIGLFLVFPFLLVG